MLNTEVKQLLREEFNEITADIINSSIFMELKKEIHHGTTRYNHSIRVAWAAFICARKLGLDYISVTRAALCHDLFRKKDCAGLTKKEINRLHPFIAAENARERFGLNEIEEDAIVNHMYPLTPIRPAYKEGRLLGYVDKCVAIAEGIGYNPVSQTIKKAAKSFTEPAYDYEQPVYSLKRR